MRLTTSSCQLGGIISARMKRWQLSGSTVGYVIGLPAFVDGPVWCRKRSRWSTPPSHCLPPTTSIEQRQNSPCHCLLNTLPSGSLYRAHPILQGSAMDKICPYCQSQHLIKNGSAYGVPKWKCKDCLRQTSFKPPRGEPLWKKETAVLLYTLGLSMNAIAKQLGVSTPSILNWIRAHAATHAPRLQPEPGESVVVMELDELWHFLQKKRTSCGSGWLLIALPRRLGMW